MPPSSPAWAKIIAASLLCVAAGAAGAETFTLPADATSAPFNCTLSGGGYRCRGSISLDKETVIRLTAPVTLEVDGDFNSDMLLTTVNNGHALTMTIGGTAHFKKDTDLTANLTVGGNIIFAKDAMVHGNLTTGGNMTVAKDSVIYGNVLVGGYLDMGKDSDIIGTCRASATNYTCSAIPSGLHHIRLEHSGNALTCSPASITVRACSAADNNGCAVSTAGVSGTVRAMLAGGTANSVGFTIPAGAGSVTVALPVNTPGAALLSVAGLSSAPANAATCWVGSTQSCTLNYADSGFTFDVPDHDADLTQPIRVKAVKKSDDTQKCVPEFQNTTKAVAFSCQYVNPSSGNSLLTLGAESAASLRCNAAPANVNLKFDKDGEAPLQVRYADAGKLSLTARYTAGGLDVQGADTFIAAPKDFLLALPAANKYVASAPFSVTITARNASGGTTPNFGRESTPATATLAQTLCLPGSNVPGAVPGVITLDDAAPQAGFNNGVASVTNAEWSEVGSIELRAFHDSYLESNEIISGIAFNSSACSNPVGPFVPHHFTTTVTDAFPANPPNAAFTYSGQPMTLTVTALSRRNKITQNYSAQGVAKSITLTALPVPTPAPGTLSPVSLAPASFNAGKASVPASYTFTNIKTAPNALTLRAHDADASSQNQDEGVAHIRSGRLRVSNVFGSAKQALKIPVRAEYWTGGSWMLNTDDTGAPATRISPGAVALNHHGVGGSQITGGTVTLVGGNGELPLSAPASGSGYIDFAVNLGAGAADNSCLAAHPPTVGAARAWLRSTYSTCLQSDPYGRATFGIYTSAQKATIHVREVFN